MWALLLACADPQPPIPPAPVRDERTDVLLVTIDTLRADRVGAYGDPHASTAVMDALAAEGLLFREAHTVTPLTLPAHASLLSGLYPLHHGLRDNAGFLLSPQVATLPAALQAQGYATAAFVSAFVLDSAWGLDRGFDLYRDPFHPQDLARVGAFGEVELPGAEVVNAAVAWWKEAGRGPNPRFAWVHLYGPHQPWTADPALSADPYRAEVAAADRLLGRLVETVGRNTLIVVTSDHGEGLWEQGERGHGLLLSRGATRVPLILRPPGGLRGAATAAARSAEPPAIRRPEGLDAALILDAVPDAPKAARIVEGAVSLVDLAPTLAELLGVPFPEVDGRSLAAALQGPLPEAPPVYAETYFPLFHHGWSPLFLAATASERLERGLRDVRVPASDDPPPAALVEVITRYAGTEPPRPGPVDGEVIARLEALGYVAPAALPSEVSGDPRDRLHTLAELDAAAADPDPKKAVARVAALVRRDPEMSDAAITLSLLQAGTGDLKGALATTESVLSRWPEHPTALANAAFLARQLGQGEEALRYARQMIALNPRDARGHRLVAAVLVDREDAPGVLAATAEGLVAAPEDPNLHYLHALAQIQVGDPAQGILHLEQARRFGTQAQDLSMWMGRAHQQAGQIDEAAKAYERASREMPGDLRPGAMAGIMLYEAGRCADALPFLMNVYGRGGKMDPQIRAATDACKAEQSAKGAKAPRGAP
jgi:tetratricopeptide (TPR) repeat protein